MRYEQNFFNISYKISKSEKNKLEKAFIQINDSIEKSNLAYATLALWGEEISAANNLRSAGLGLLGNLIGDEKAVACIEDTAVPVAQLAAYIAEFQKLMDSFNQEVVYYAHAGAGELHLRPILNLKTKEGQKQFRTIAEEIATLVKSYNGSLSGEHGDGRLRGEFIPQVLGEHNYQLCKQLKNIWDPNNIFNPGKIVNTPPMDKYLRFEPDQQTPVFDTIYDFSENQGIVRATELCNGSGDCRKTILSGGTMCPSYQATKDEKDTTRARANILREMLSKTDTVKPFSRPEIKEVLDLCLSCKGCSSECPSNVDMAKLKGEWQYQYYQDKGIPLRSKLIGNFTMIMSLASKIPWAYRLIFSNKFSGNIAKAIAGFAIERSMPTLGALTFKQWLRTNFKPLTNNRSGKVLYLFCDEFTEYNDVEIGQKAVLLLNRLGYQVKRIEHPESGRSFMSKGMLKEAKQLAEKNIALFEFIKDMDYAYSAADIIISRAGAIAISELCCVGKPVILVPSPNVSENHQWHNANVLAEKNAVLLSEKRNLIKNLEVDETLGQLLVSEGFPSIEDIAQSTPENISKIDLKHATVTKRRGCNGQPNTTALESLFAAERLSWYFCSTRHLGRSALGCSRLRWALRAALGCSEPPRAALECSARGCSGIGAL